MPKLLAGQSNAERRKIRKTIRKNVATLEENKQAVVRTDNDMLSTIVKEGTSFFKKNVRYQKDAVEDARLVVLTAELAKEQARGLANAFSSLDFDLLKDNFVKSKYRSRTTGVDWEALGNDCGVLWRTVPSTSFFKGLMHVEKVKTARQKRKRMVDAPVETVAPEIKNQMKSTRAGVLAKRDARLRAFLIRKLLPNTKPKAVMHSNKPQRVLDMVETLFHPTSFSKTVEHCFYYSFLVHQGNGRFDLSADEKLPMIGPCVDVGGGAVDGDDGGLDGEKETDDSELEPHQHIMSLDMDLWLRARRAHKVHEPMLDDFGKGTPVDLDVARGESGVEALESKNTPHAHANALVASQVLPAGESDLDVGLLTDSEADSEEEEGDEEEEEVVVRVKRQRT